MNNSTWPPTHITICVIVRLRHWDGRAPRDRTAAEPITDPLVCKRLALKSLLMGIPGYEKQTPLNVYQNGFGKNVLKEG